MALKFIYKTRTREQKGLYFGLSTSIIHNILGNTCQFIAKFPGIRMRFLFEFLCLKYNNLYFNPLEFSLYIHDDICNWFSNLKM